jgi:hypothetical protein
MCETGTLKHFWWQWKFPPLRKAVLRFLKKLEIELPYDQVIPLLGIYQRKVRPNIVETPAHYVHCSTIHNSQALKTM